MKVLGIDIGGSAFKGAPVDTKTGRLLAERHRVEVDAPCPTAQGLAAVREIVQHFKWKGPGWQGENIQRCRCGWVG
jgi:polyphosphate glucokinase